jgi:putative transposase
MAWRAATVMDERANFIFELKKSDLSFSELCRRYQISRPTGYKWLKRHTEHSVQGLGDRSHRPHSCPHRVAPEVERRIVELRRRRTWGAPKLRLLLEEELGWAPAVSTIHRVLDRHGLVHHRKKRRVQEKPPRPPFEADRPNALWTADFKGQFRLRDGSLCYPLTVQDAYSRFLLDCRALTGPRLELTVPCFRRLFRTYGLPDRIRTDNGQPFASYASLGRLSRLSAWWVQLGVRPEFIQPGKPSQNGRHERMHRTLKRDATYPPRAHLRAQQHAFNDFRRVYNEERPHQALDQKRPATLYSPSPRLLATPQPIKYPTHFEVRWVSQLGNIRWQKQFVFVSRMFKYEPIGLEQLSPGLWAVFYAFHQLGWLDEKDGRIIDRRGNRRRRAHPRL